MPRRKKASTQNLRSWAIGEAKLIPNRLDTPPPDCSDHELFLPVSDGSETAPEDNVDPESDIEAIKASLKGFYQIFHPHQRCKDLLEAERAKVSSQLLPLNYAHYFIPEVKDWVTSTHLHWKLCEIG